MILEYAQQCLLKTIKNTRGSWTASPVLIKVKEKFYPTFFTSKNIKMVKFSVKQALLDARHNSLKNCTSLQKTDCKKRTEAISLKPSPVAAQRTQLSEEVSNIFVSLSIRPCTDQTEKCLTWYFLSIPSYTLLVRQENKKVPFNSGNYPRVFFHIYIKYMERIFLNVVSFRLAGCKQELGPGPLPLCSI